jgi:hypothetical protein
MPKDTCSTLSAGAELVLPEQVTVALTELAGAPARACSLWPWGPAWGAGQASGGRRGPAGRPKGPPQSQSYAVRHGTQPGQVTLGGGGYGSIARGYAAPMMGRTAVADLAGVHWDRAAGPARPGTDAGQAVHPPLRRRTRAGRRSGRAGRERDLEVRGLAPVRGRDRARPGRAGRRGPDRAGPGRAHGRRGQGRRALLCVALGITGDGTKVPLGLAEGATKNATVVTDLLVGYASAAWTRRGRSWS